jgi:hypothetical protein
MYCNAYSKDKLVAQKDYEKDAMLKVVPHLLTQKNEHFSIKNSTFVMEAYKAGSCR